MGFYNFYNLLLVILLIVILVKVNRYAKESKYNLKSLEDKIDRLQKFIVEQKTPVSNSAIVAEKIREKVLPNVEEPIGEIIPTIIPIQESTIQEENIPKHEPEDYSDEEEFAVMEEKHSSTVHFTNDIHPVETIKQEAPKRKYVEMKKPWLQKFKEENPDIEKFIGENLINKIGILILVLGISFFVKYAIDKNWINEPARVGIGILAGAIVLGVAHRLKANYKAFSSVFVAGAFAVFYFTIGIAFQEYHLFSQTVAFVIMVVITIFASFISVSYDRQELGVMTLIAGFAVPFMVSTGDGNYLVLFTYIAILNIGMLLISYYKKWNIVNVLAFVFTCVLYIGWWTNITAPAKVPHLGAFIFATLFYLIFSIATVINNLRSVGDFSKIQYFLIVGNTFFFFGIGLAIISDWGLPIKGLFTVALAIYNLIFATVLYRRFGLNKNTVYLLVGLTLTFATLTIPIQFNGNYITLFWACEAVLLFWLAKKSKIDVFKWSAAIVQGLMVVSLMMDWGNHYSDIKDSGDLIHPVFLVGIVAIVSLFYTYYLLKNDREITSFFGFKFNPNIYRKGLFMIGIVISYFVGILETYYLATIYNGNFSSVTSYTAGFHYLFSIVLIYFTFKKDAILLKKATAALGIFNVVLFIFLFGNLPIQEMNDYPFNPVKNFSAYLIHFVILFSVVYFLYLLVKKTLHQPIFAELKTKYALWILAFVVVVILSQELIIQSVFFNSGISAEKWSALSNKNINSDSYALFQDEFFATIYKLKTQIVKVGFPILWGVISFVLLIIGIKKDWKQLRIIALSLLGITIAKLFLYDINDASETGKIIAFILLGVLILIISFVYQKLKKLVSDQPKNTEDEEVK